MLPNQFVTYAQNGEDILLWRALKHVQNGFYIDVGAQDPIVDSVTKAFYDRGWRGINIEPVQHWHERLVEQRPRDVNLCIAASDHDGELKLYESVDTGLSTSVEKFARSAAQLGWRLHENAVPCKTLADICEQHVKGPVHFLKIDCEGAEAAALRGMPLHEVRPWIVLVEASEPNSSVPTHARWESLLTGNGYEFVYGDGINRYYVAVEKAGLRAVFGFPPNALDDYIHASELRARELQREIAGLQAEVCGRGVEIDRLQQDYRDITEEREVLRAEHLLRVEAQRAQKAEILRLQGDYRDVSNDRALLNADLANAQRERSGLEREAERHAGNARALAVEISRLQTECRDLTEMRETMRSQLEHLQREHQVLASEHQNVRAQLASMRLSRSWRLTSPLRVLRRACGQGSLAARHLARTVLRPAARASRPMLRRLSQNEAIRRLLVSALGRDAPIVRHGRLFLFGEQSRSAAVPVADLEHAVTPDASMWSRRERMARSELQRALVKSDDSGGGT